MIQSRSVGMLALLSVVFGTPTVSAQAKPPLVWAADADGGKPFVFQDPENPNEIIGFEVDLRDALARELGRPIHFKQYDFNELVSGLERGDFDFAMNGLEITPDRLARIRFSRPYYIYQQLLVVRAGETRFKTLEDVKSLNDSQNLSLTIGTLNNTAAERLLKKMDIPYTAYPDQDNQYKDQSFGRGIQGVLLDLPAALYYAAPAPRPKYAERIPNLEFAGSPFAEGYYGIAIRKGNEDLLQEINAALTRLIQNGELKRICTKWELWNIDQYKLGRLEQIVEEEAPSMPFAMYFPLLLRAASFTVWISVASMALAVALGLPIALCRLYGPAPVRFLATVYVELFRGIPILLLLYFLYFGLPGIAQQFALPVALQLSPYHAALLGFGLNYAAYEAEIYRAGISAVPAGQWEAAAALGMSTPVTFRRIILPQAIRTILPPMTNDFVALFKDTSIISVLAIVELTKQYQILTKSGGGYLQIGLATAALYLIMSVPLGYLSRFLEQRWGGVHR